MPVEKYGGRPPDYKISNIAPIRVFGTEGSNIQLLMKSSLEKSNQCLKWIYLGISLPVNVNNVIYKSADSQDVFKRGISTKTQIESETK